MNYHVLREFADSWGLLAMTLFFLSMVAWTFRKGSGDVHRRTARMIFDEDQHNG